MKQIWNWIKKRPYPTIFIFWWLVAVVAIFIFHVFSMGGGADWDNNPWAAPWNMGTGWLWLLRLLLMATFIFTASIAAAFTSFLYYILVLIWKHSPKGLAVISLVLGILNIMLTATLLKTVLTPLEPYHEISKKPLEVFTIVAFILAILATAFGVIANRQAKNDSSQSGRGIATIGLCLGGIEILLMLLVVGFVLRIWTSTTTFQTPTKLLLQTY